MISAEQGPRSADISPGVVGVDVLWAMGVVWAA